jgi:hypothetical protein
MSVDLPKCDELSWLQYPSFSQVRELFVMDGLRCSPIRTIIHWVVNRSSRWTWSLLLIALGGFKWLYVLQVQTVLWIIPFSCRSLTSHRLQNLVHIKLFFNWFPYVKTYASRLLLVLLSAHSNRLEYPLLIILRIPSWLSGLTWYGVLANELDPVDVYPWWSVSNQTILASVPCWSCSHYHIHMANLAPSL